MLEHVPIPSASLRELNRIVENDGYLIITFLPNRWSYTEFALRNVFKHGQHRRLYSTSQLRQMLLDHGFERVEIGHHQLLPSLTMGHKLSRRRGWVTLSAPSSSSTRSPNASGRYVCFAPTSTPWHANETTCRPAVTAERGARAIAQTIVNKAAMMLINAGTGIITARALQPDGRGELTALILWPVFLSYLMTLGIPSSLIYALRRRPIGARERRDRTRHDAGARPRCGRGRRGRSAARARPSLRARHRREAQWFLVSTPVLALVNTARVVLEARGLFSISNRIQLGIPGAALAALILYSSCTS